MAGAVDVKRSDTLAIVTIRRGKVNAINESMVVELRETFSALAADATIDAVILTGGGRFFSFGFDIPSFLDCSKMEFRRFLVQFTSLYTELFLFPRPLIAALNGHTIAGGCMLSLACDRRIMVDGGAKIALNEITFGASVFSGSVEMLLFCTGRKAAEEILYSGSMFDAEAALRLGLVDRVTDAAGLMEAAKEEARRLAERDRTAFSALKKLMRDHVAARMHEREIATIDEFIAIWYSKETHEQLQRIVIHD